MPSAYLASRLSGRFSGDLLKVYFFTNQATPGFLTVDRKSIRLWSIFERKRKNNSIGFFSTFSFFLSFLFLFFLTPTFDPFLNFSRYILRNVTNKLYTLFSRYFTSFFNIFQTFFFFFLRTLFSTIPIFFRIFSLYIYIFVFPLSQNVFIFHDCRHFRTLYVSVLISNLYFFPLIFPRCGTFKENSTQTEFTTHFAKEEFRLKFSPSRFIDASIYDRDTFRKH